MNLVWTDLDRREPLLNRVGIMSQPERLLCSFCKKTQDDVVKLIAGPDVHICNECVDLCNEIMSEEKVKQKDSEKQSELLPPQLKKPQTIYERLSNYVIGQEYAKKVISVAVYKHYRRILTPKIGIIHNIKENILLIGPTGTGKTFIAKTLAQILDVPVGISDATALTEAGYVGEDVESVLAYLYKAADYDLKRAEKGIIYIDEIDKITRKQANLSITRDVSGEGVQHALLTILGGGTSRFDPKNKRKHPGGDLVEMNTDEILFICGGSFEGIEQHILERLRRSLGVSTAALAASSNELRAHITQADLIAFGFAPEFAARFTAIVPLATLDEDDFVRILNESNDSLIKQYEFFFAGENIGISLYRRCN